MRVGKILIGLIMLAILLAIVAFAVWNSEEKIFHLQFFKWKWDAAESGPIPFVYTVYIAFLAGVVLALVFGFLYYFEAVLAVRRLRKEKRRLEEELTALRNLPVEEGLLETTPKEDEQ